MFIVAGSAVCRNVQRKVSVSFKIFLGLFLGAATLMREPNLCLENLTLVRIAPVATMWRMISKCVCCSQSCCAYSKCDGWLLKSRDFTPGVETGRSQLFRGKRTQPLVRLSRVKKAGHQPLDTGLNKPWEVQRELRSLSYLVWVSECPTPCSHCIRDG